MTHPFRNGNTIDWSHRVHHQHFVEPNQTVEHVYRRMLVLGIDFAPAIDKNSRMVGLVSFKMLSAALSARFGQELFARKILAKTSVPSVIFCPIDDAGADVQRPLIIPLAQAAIIRPTHNFFEA